MVPIMGPAPLFTRDELETAFRLILPQDVAARCARQWFDEFASESVDERGYFLYEEWWNTSGTPSSLAHGLDGVPDRSEEHTSELQSHHDLVCRLLLEKKKKKTIQPSIK